MSDTEIVKFLAEKVMGWTMHPCTSGGLLVMDKPNGERFTFGPERTAYMVPEWNPLTSIKDAFEVQAAIPEEKRESYLLALCDVTEPQMDRIAALWVVTTATPRQRSIAAVRAFGGTV